MADYYNLQQLSQRTRVSESEIRQLQEAGFLSPVAKNGRFFYSSQQAYRLQTAVRWALKDHLALKDAFCKVEEQWLAARQEQQPH
jgi:DNA-binding transcriptional MerR regulator